MIDNFKSFPNLTITSLDLENLRLQSFVDTSVPFKDFAAGSSKKKIFFVDKKLFYFRKSLYRRSVSTVKSGSNYCWSLSCSVSYCRSRCLFSQSSTWSSRLSERLKFNKQKKRFFVKITWTSNLLIQNHFLSV